MTRAAGTCLVVSAAWRGVRAPVVCKPVVRGTPAYLYYTFPTEAAAARGARVALLALVHSFGAARRGRGVHHRLACDRRATATPRTTVTDGIKRGLVSSGFAGFARREPYAASRRATERATSAAASPMSHI